ncbi:hypothetical protein LTR97_012206 [Elasticomyces elasticus]|uniref:Uncharacterized protein n=1 Tax=Elasticomyces elasticus TaxID=574655 RepID=A0AAN7W2J0_9PEZI|nr:hypothetical protein LTR97_012206 [Elasticomyces elasticus]
MAPTRRSLPSSTTTSTSQPISSSAAPPPQQEMTSKQKRVLANLAIDAEPGLLLAHAQKKVGMVGTGKVYHYRGAVYELLGNEPKEWLAEERELERLEGERVRVEEVTRKEREGREARELEVELQRERRMEREREREREAEEAKRKRKSGDEDEEQTQQQQQKKRRRMGDVEAKTDGGKKRMRESESAEDTADSSSEAHAASAAEKRKPHSSLAGREIGNAKTKHSVPTQPSYFPRPLAQPKRLKRADSGVAALPYWPLPAPKPKRKRAVTKAGPGPDEVLAEELRTKNFTNNGGREEWSCAELAREREVREMRVKAANQGLQTEMLGTEVVRRGREGGLKRLFGELFQANKGVREKEGELRGMRGRREEVRRRQRGRGVGMRGGGRFGGQATEGADEDGVGRERRGGVEGSGVVGLGGPSSTDGEAGGGGGGGGGGEVRDSGSATRGLGTETKTAIPLAFKTHEQRLLGSGLTSARARLHTDDDDDAAAGKDGDGDEVEREERADSPFALGSTCYAGDPLDTYVEQNSHVKQNNHAQQNSHAEQKSQAQQNSHTQQKKTTHQKAKQEERITEGRAEPYLFGGRMVGESFVELERRQRWEGRVLGGWAWERVSGGEMVGAGVGDVD